MSCAEETLYIVYSPERIYLKYKISKILFFFSVLLTLHDDLKFIPVFRLNSVPLFWRAKMKVVNRIQIHILFRVNKRRKLLN